MPGQYQMSDPDLNSPTATLEASPAEIEREAQHHRRRMTLNMGPQHPSTHGVLRVLLELDGETVMQRLSRHRLSSHRHREAMRGTELAAGRAAHRPRRLPAPT